MTSEDDARVELLQGTLDLIVLRALTTMGPQAVESSAAPKASGERLSAVISRKPSQMAPTQ